MATPRSSRWEDACIAAAVLAIDPKQVGGISLRSAAGPVRDAWIDICTQLFPRRTQFLRVPLNVGDDRLLGGLDLAATLQAGRPVAEQGILARAHGGVIVLPMAERYSPGVAAKIGCVLDRREVLLQRDGFDRRVASRFAVIALDEGIEPDERPPDSLLERLALHVDLNGLPLSVTAETGRLALYNISRARDELGRVRVADEVLGALCEVSIAFGVSSARGAWFALRVARALAALEGRDEVIEEDVATACRLVLAPRALVAPAAPPPQPAQSSPDQTAESQSAVQQPQEPHGDAAADESQSDAKGRPQQPDDDLRNSAGAQETDTSAQQPPDRSSPPAAGDPQPAGSLGDRVVAATKASLPVNFLGQCQPTRTQTNNSRQAGRTGSEHRSTSRGRPTGTRAGELRPGARVNIIETLRAAAPWQRLRRLASERAAANQPPPSATTKRREPRPSPLIRVSKDDIRTIRFTRRSRSTTIFVVDASGSAALHRLAEVKGAVELMLAESYVRRDRVALISFRGAAAQLLLPPTNSLVRAKRELASLPGGGGTPLAIGIDTARVLADSLKRRGESPIVVVLTDGRPNITRDGKGNRVRAEADAVSAARMMRINSIASLMVDTAPQPRVSTEQFAREMGARYVPLPYADAGTLASVVSQCGRQAHV
jgi:magnesium chelatase subunit D